MNKTTTAEDVFYLYERNKTFYDNCRLAGRKCPNEVYDVECYCQVIEPVLPITIGDQCVPCNFNRKVYIKQGEECAICMETIYQKNNAYLTSCGHSFHKTCLFNAFEIKAKNKHNFPCPLCRARLGYPEFYCRYTCNIFKDPNQISETNFLDTLEEFWLSKEFNLIQICSNGHNHALGMKNNCDDCLDYRING